MFSIVLNKPINKSTTCLCLVKLLKEKSGTKLESVKVNKLPRFVGISEINYIELSCVGLLSTVSFEVQVNTARMILSVWRSIDQTHV